MFMAMYLPLLAFTSVEGQRYFTFFIVIVHVVKDIGAVNVGLMFTFELIGADVASMRSTAV